MKANAGDRLIVRGAHTGAPERKALILEVRGRDGGPPSWCGGTTRITKGCSFPGWTIIEHGEHSSSP